MVRPSRRSLSACAAVIVLGAGCDALFGLDRVVEAQMSDGNGPVNDVLIDAPPDAPPRFGSQDYIKASNPGAGDQFGFSTALSADGSTLVVGSIREDSGIANNQNDNGVPEAGAVYVFVRAGTAWTQQAYLKPSNIDTNDLFGLAVAISADGSTIAVGSPGEDGTSATDPDNGISASGAVYVFRRSGTAWAQAAYLKSPNVGIGDAFGTSVAMAADGSVLVIGAPKEDSSTTGVGSTPNEGALNSGAAYVFTYATAWTLEAYIKASNTDADDDFGIAVAISPLTRSTIAVSATKEDSRALGVNGSQSDDLAGESGAVYVFKKSGAVWSQNAYIKASNTDAGDLFGSSIALSPQASRLVVGAPGEDGGATGINGDANDNSTPNAGAAYILDYEAATWSHTAYVKTHNTDAGDQFGTSVAFGIGASRLVIGADEEAGGSMLVDGMPADNSKPGAGAAYVFEEMSGWPQVSYLKAFNSDQQQAFGRAVAISSDGAYMAVCAVGDDSGAAGINGNGSDETMMDAGAVQIFR